MKKVFTAALVFAVCCSFTLAEGLPGSKAAASTDLMVNLGASCVAEGGVDCLDETGWTTVQQMYIKTANQKDLAVDAALMCWLVTGTEVRSRNGETDVSTAWPGIDVRIKVTDSASGEVYWADPTGENGITYCDRIQTLSAELTGTDCYVDTSDEGTAQDPLVCLDDEMISLYLDTFSTHAFNFLVPNVDSGVKKIEVQANAFALGALGGTKKGSAVASAMIGYGSTLVEEVRLIKDADGSNVVEF
jgi:hypothetical protein